MTSSFAKLAGWITERNWPRLTCPYCKSGSLHPDGLVTFEDPVSLKQLARVQQNLEGPDELSGTFAGALICDDYECRSKSAIAGDWSYSWDFDEEEMRTRLHHSYRVKFIHPTIWLIPVPDKTPPNVKAAVVAASELLWLNPNAAANQLRVAVEELLTSQKVKRTTISSKGGKRNRLSLHDRIVHFRTVKPEIASVLEAVKWIGNSGSHESLLSAESVLRSADFLGLALRKLYDDSDAQLLGSARVVNRRRGLPGK